MTKIVDTSEWAGEPDWNALRERGAEGVIVRTSSGPTHRDKLAAKHVIAASKAGLVVLAGYHFLYSWHDGAHQAAFAIEVAAALGLPVSPDFEPVAKGTRPTDAPHLARIPAMAFLHHYRSLTGRAAVVYGAAFYLRDMRLEGPDVGPLWVADTRPAPPAPMVPPPWSRHVLWQHIHNEEVPGPHGPAKVDWNYSDLTIDELARVFRGDPGTRPPPRPFVGPAETFKARGGLDIG